MAIKGSKGPNNLNREENKRFKELQKKYVPRRSEHTLTDKVIIKLTNNMPMYKKWRRLLRRINDMYELTESEYLRKEFNQIRDLLSAKTLKDYANREWNGLQRINKKLGITIPFSKHEALQKLFDKGMSEHYSDAMNSLVSMGLSKNGRLNIKSMWGFLQSFYKGFNEYGGLTPNTNNLSLLEKADQFEYKVKKAYEIVNISKRKGIKITDVNLRNVYNNREAILNRLNFANKAKAAAGEEEVGLMEFILDILTTIV